MADSRQPVVHGTQGPADAGRGGVVLRLVIDHVRGGILIGAFLGYFLLPDSQTYRDCLGALRSYLNALEWDAGLADSAWAAAVVGAVLGAVINVAGGLTVHARRVRRGEEAACVSGFTPEPAPPILADVTAMVEEELSESSARENLVTPADVDAFVRQPSPRKVPARILRYRERFAPEVPMGVGIIFAGGGSVFTYGFGSQALASGTGSWAADWFGVALGLLFLAIGGPIAFYSVRARYRIRRVLRYGRVAAARIETIEPPGPSIDADAILLLTVQYRAGGRNVRASCKVMGRGADRANKLAAEKKTAAILYDPADPQRVLFLADLVGVVPD